MAIRPGLLPLRSTGQLVQRRVPVTSNNTNRIRKGDAVVFTGAGCVLATTTNTAIAGPMLGCSYMNSAGARIEAVTLPAATTYSGTDVFPANGTWLFIPDDANTDLIASCDVAITNASLLLNAALTLNSTATKYSDHAVSGTGMATTATFPVRLMEFVEAIDALSDADLINAAVIVRVNAGFFSPSMTVTGTA